MQFQLPKKLTNVSVVSTYIPQIENFTDSFLTRIRSNLKTPITINHLALAYSYDASMHLAFGQAGGFISGQQSDTARKVMVALKSAGVAYGLFYHVPWIMTVVTAFAMLPGPLRGLNNWSEKMLIERKKVSSNRLLIWSWLWEWS